MKITLPLLLAALTLTAADPDTRRKPTPAGAPPPANEAETFSSLDRPSPRHATIPAGMINFEEAELPASQWSPVVTTNATNVSISNPVARRFYRLVN